MAMASFTTLGVHSVDQTASVVWVMVIIYVAIVLNVILHGWTTKTSGIL